MNFVLPAPDQASHDLRRAYRGRFAPTPSGPLHMGSLLTALASYLQARRAGGSWLLRMDDLDAERSRADHADTILSQLEAHRLLWDEPVRWQSQHVEQYEQAFAQLCRHTTCYRCTCTRADLAAESRLGIDGPVYSGRCRHSRRVEGKGSWRLAVAPGVLDIEDPWQGTIERCLVDDVGDFVVRRADGLIGYQLACVIDEQAQRITEVVRGADLIGSSIRQRHLQRLLQLVPPEYRHLPLLLDANGNKLSKQNHAKPIDNSTAAANLQHCLKLLGQDPPLPLESASAEETIEWAVVSWNPQRIPRKATLADPN